MPGNARVSIYSFDRLAGTSGYIADSISETLEELTLRLYHPWNQQMLTLFPELSQLQVAVTSADERRALERVLASRIRWENVDILER